MISWPSWDLELFHLLNGQLHTPLLDSLMPLVTDRWFLVPAALLLLGLGVARRGREGRRAALAALLAVGLSDVITSQALKPLVHRPRPCRTEADVRLLVRCGGRNGFPSNHAANAGALAGAVAVFAPASLLATVPLALGVAWSRVYVGVHYPIDVAAGLLFGGGVGWTVALLVPGVRRRKDSRLSAGDEGEPIA